mmetsp:Transcript_49623/g.78924  ORF Transcript_49623/g.78924 Transcript_49623/m.78924 type:complete len:527 (+) Transcript_49623:182-1762(+)
MSKAATAPKGKAAAPKAVSKAGPSNAKAAQIDNSRPVTYHAPGSSSSAVSTSGSSAAAYPKAPPEKPRTSITYSGPLGPSRDAALRARPKAAADIPDGPLRLSFGNLTLSSTPPLAPPVESQSPPFVPPRKTGSADGDANSMSSAKRPGDTEAILKPASVPKKRSGSTKKRRPGNVASTRPQPFSFSTDTRKGRRTRQNGLVVEEDGPEDARAKKVGAKSRPKWFSSSMAALPKSTSQSNSLPNSATDNSSAAVSGFAASSGNDQEETPATVPAISSIGSASVSVPTSAPNGTGTFTPRQEKESRQIGLSIQTRTIARQKSSGYLSNDEPNSPLLPNATIPVTHSAGSSCSASGTAGRRHFARVSSRDTRPRIASARDYQVRSDATCDDGQDEDIGSTSSAERTRSTSILRGRLGSHLARAAASQHAECASVESERHVSFHTAEEVRQFSVVDTAPSTTRVSRRVFGGDLQVVLGSGSSTAISGNHRSQGLSAIPHGVAAERKANVLLLASSAPRPCIRDLQAGVD